MFLGNSWIWWVLGGLGGAGLLVPAVMFGGPAVGVFLMKIVNFLLFNRWGNVLLAAIVFFAIGDIRRSHLDGEIIAAQKAEYARRSKEIVTETREAVTKELAEAKQQEQAIDADVKEFKDALPPVAHTTDNPFRVGADSCRLRLIAGQPGCEPRKGPRRVPTPRPRPSSGGGDR